MTSPLHGIRVIDFGSMVAGPYCGRMLADLGAEVIKLEGLEGDFMRSRPPMKGGQSLYFGSLNCGKESIAIDLKHPRSVALVKDLVARSDVLLENFRPGVMARLGFDYAAMQAVNPKLVYCSISGFGQSGADQERPAFAPIVQATSGYELANLGYQPGLERPLNAGIMVTDYLAGVHAFGAICAALVKRARTGEGSRIDCALTDSIVGLLGYEVAAMQGPIGAPRPLYQATKAHDGFFIVAPVTQANFEALVKATGQAQWLTDPRFGPSATRALKPNWDALLQELDQWAADKSLDECESRMSACGVPFGRYQTVAELMASPYAAERELFATVKTGTAEFQTPKPPYKMEGIAVGESVPALGEHSAAVLARLLGYTPAEIEQLVAERVVA